MRVRTIILLLLVCGVAALGVWAYIQRESLARSWAISRVAAAPNFETAQQRMRWFEAGPQAADRRRALVEKWGTGDEQFDLYLARHVVGPSSSVSLREAFALQLSRRPALLPLWARYWVALTGPPSSDHVRMLAGYRTLAEAKPSTALPWREVLDLQAVFALLGRPDLALGLTPANWSARIEAAEAFSIDKPVGED